VFDYKLWLQEILGTMSVPYSYGFYQGTSNIWVVAIVYNVVGAKWTDNTERETRYSIQVTIYSKEDNSTVVEEVKDKMLQAGCSRISESDSFDPISNFLQTTLIFQYERNVE
jgi:hypothetical protein